MKKDDLNWQAGYALISKDLQTLSEALMETDRQLKLAQILIQALDEIFKEFCAEDKEKLKVFISAWVESFGVNDEK